VNLGGKFAVAVLGVGTGKDVGDRIGDPIGDLRVVDGAVIWTSTL